jgi:hypothetical protein
MTAASSSCIRALASIAFALIVLAPVAEGRIESGARTGHDAPGGLVLAQRCFTYKGELKCF